MFWIVGAVLKPTESFRLSRERRSHRGDGFVHSLGQNRQSFFHGVARDRQRRSDLDCLPPGSDRREEKQALVETTFDNVVSKVRVRYFRARLHGLQTAD